MKGPSASGLASQAARLSGIRVLKSISETKLIMAFPNSEP